MKIKSLINCALIAALVAMGSAEMFGQKRATGKKTSSTRTASSSKKTSSGTALNASNLVNTEYFTKTFTGQNDIWLFQWISLNPDGKAVWDYIEGDLEVSWKINGNNLRIVNGSKDLFNVTSNNGGKTFTGKMTSANETCNFYDITESHGSEFSAETVEKDLLAGKYYTFFGFQPKANSLITGFPVTVKFTKDEETPGCGTFKVTGDNKMMAALGNMKFDYEFEENQFVATNSDGKTLTFSYDKYSTQYFVLSLGSSRIGNQFLFFIKK